MSAKVCMWVGESCVSNIAVVAPPLPVCRELVKVELKPDGRQQRMESESSQLTENLTSPEVHSVNSFVTVYAFLCRYYGIPFREDVSWVSGGVCGVCICVSVCMCAYVHGVCVCAHVLTRAIHSFKLVPLLSEGGSVWYIGGGTYHSHDTLMGSMYTYEKNHRDQI